jgi:hypothetical protein
MIYVTVCCYLIESEDKDMGGGGFNPFSSISKAIKDPFSTDTISAIGMHLASGGVVNGATDYLFNVGANALGIPNTGDLYSDPLLALDPGGLVYQSKDPDVLAKQAKLDIGGYGAKPTLLAQQEAKAQSQSLADAQAREMEARRMASSQLPAGERAKLNINTGAGASNLGVLGLIVEPTVDKKKSKVGLGGLDSVQAGLGFGAKGKVS